jgi:hypothetical protein
MQWKVTGDEYSHSAHPRLLGWAAQLVNPPNYVPICPLWGFLSTHTFSEISALALCQALFPHKMLALGKRPELIGIEPSFPHQKSTSTAAVYTITFDPATARRKI